MIPPHPRVPSQKASGMVAHSLTSLARAAFFLTRRGLATTYPPGPDGRAAAVFEQSRVEKSPGSTATRRRATPAGSDPRDSATESRPPSEASAKEGKGERVR